MDSIAVSEEDAKIIERQVESGRYESASDVISAGLRLLEERESETDLWMRREIPRRLAEYDRDPSIGIPLDEAMKRIDELHEHTLKATL